MGSTLNKGFSAAHRAGGQLPLSVKANQKALYRQIADQLLGKRHIPVMATDREIDHYSAIRWA
jgi:hypothetical protein